MRCEICTTPIPFNECFYLFRKFGEKNEEKVGRNSVVPIEVKACEGCFQEAMDGLAVEAGRIRVKE